MYKFSLSFSLNLISNYLSQDLKEKVIKDLNNYPNIE